VIKVVEGEIDWLPSLNWISPFFDGGCLLLQFGNAGDLVRVSHLGFCLHLGSHNHVFFEHHLRVFFFFFLNFGLFGGFQFLESVQSSLLSQLSLSEAIGVSCPLGGLKIIIVKIPGSSSIWEFGFAIGGINLFWDTLLGCLLLPSLFFWLNHSCLVSGSSKILFKIGLLPSLSVGASAIFL